MEESLEFLKKRRTATKGWLSRSISYLTELLEDESTLHELFVAVASNFDDRLTALDELQAVLELKIIDSAELEEDIERADDFHRYARRIRASVQQRLKTNSEVVESLSLVTSLKDKSEVKLP